MAKVSAAVVAVVAAAAALLLLEIDRQGHRYTKNAHEQVAEEAHERQSWQTKQCKATAGDTSKDAAASVAAASGATLYKQGSLGKEPSCWSTQELHASSGNADVATAAVAALAEVAAAGSAAEEVPVAVMAPVRRQNLATPVVQEAVGTKMSVAIADCGHCVTSTLPLTYERHQPHEATAFAWVQVQLGDVQTEFAVI